MKRNGKCRAMSGSLDKKVRDFFPRVLPSKIRALGAHGVGGKGQLKLSLNPGWDRLAGVRQAGGEFIGENLAGPQGS